MSHPSFERGRGPRMLGQARGFAAEVLRPRGIALLLLAMLLPLAILTASPPAQAQVSRFEVLERMPAFGGRSFGEVGSYELIRGQATLELDPSEARNRVIADLELAPRNAAGKVQAQADVVLLVPSDPSRGNGSLLVDVPNRGRKLAPQLFDDNPQPAANQLVKQDEAGIGFMARQGYTVAWIGWQGDIDSRPGQLALAVPRLAGVSGAVRNEFQFDHLRNPVTATLSETIADPASVRISVRAHWAQPRQSPPDLAVKVTGASTIEITRPAGFDAGALFEVTFTGKDPAVYGIGFASVRDITAFLRHDISGRNPLAAGGKSRISRSIGFGVSQSGRYLRDFLWLGFNEDLQGRRVFDGLMPHVAGARRMATNERFGQPSRNARHPQDPAWTIDSFPFTYAVMTDPLTGRTDGLLARCLRTSTCPKVMQTDSEHEWWGSRASLLVTDTEGHHIDLPDNVRAYMIAGTPHFAAPGEAMRAQAAMALPVNPLHAGPPMRALLQALDAWVARGVMPPESRVPMRSHGTLVEAARALPAPIPGLPYAALHTPATHADHSVLPPRDIGRYPVFVPLADGDGMSVAGIRMTPLEVPLATYTGWNPRANGYGPGVLFPLQGAVLPLPANSAQRQASADPRLSVSERYPDPAAYLAAVERATARAVRERLLLPEDAERAIAAARAGRLAQLESVRR